MHVNKFNGLLFLVQNRVYTRFRRCSNSLARLLCGEEDSYATCREIVSVATIQNLTDGGVRYQSLSAKRSKLADRQPHLIFSSLYHHRRALVALALLLPSNCHCKSLKMAGTINKPKSKPPPSTICIFPPLTLPRAQVQATDDSVAEQD